MTTPAVPAVLDLDAGRAERAKARAAKHEGTGATLPIRFGGEVIAELQAEFPMAALEPLTRLDVDIAYILRGALQAVKATGRDQQIVAATFLVDVLAANPSLPAGLLTAVREIARSILGEAGYTAFTGQQPTPWDVRALAIGILSWYGLSLGEFLPSETSPEGDGGETSKPTSSVPTGSTRAASGNRRGKKGLSVPAGS